MFIKIAHAFPASSFFVNHRSVALPDLLEEVITLTPESRLSKLLKIAVPFQIINRFLPPPTTTNDPQRILFDKDKLGTLQFCCALATIFDESESLRHVKYFYFSLLASVGWKGFQDFVLIMIH